MKKSQRNVEVELQNPNAFDSIPDEKDCQNWLSAAIQTPNKALSIVIRFVDKKESADLNLTYRQKKSATNVLSFPFEMPDIPELHEERRHLGDLVLCEPVVITEAEQQNKSIKQHFAHLIVHGTLHLQGYDHINDDDAQEMESLEISILESLGFDNPYESR